jgi:hypothetical protein
MKKKGLNPKKSLGGLVGISPGSPINSWEVARSIPNHSCYDHLIALLSKNIFVLMGWKEDAPSQSALVDSEGF